MPRKSIARHCGWLSGRNYLGLLLRPHLETGQTKDAKLRLEAARLLSAQPPDNRCLSVCVACPFGAAASVRPACRSDHTTRHTTDDTKPDSFHAANQTKPDTWVCSGSCIHMQCGVRCAVCGPVRFVPQALVSAVSALHIVFTRAMYLHT